MNKICRLVNIVNVTKVATDILSIFFISFEKKKLDRNVVNQRENQQILSSTITFFTNC